MSKKGIDPLFWWALGIISGLVLAGVGYGIATAPPGAPVARRVQPEQTDRNYGPLLRTGQILLFIAPAVSFALRSRGKGDEGEPARPGPTPASTEQAIKRVTTYTHDRNTAIRLMMAVAETHSTKPLDWVADKVIHDLVRDRRP